MYNIYIIINAQPFITVAMLYKLHFVNDVEIILRYYSSYNIVYQTSHNDYYKIICVSMNIDPTITIPTYRAHIAIFDRNY